MDRLNIIYLYLTRKIEEKHIILKIINNVNSLESRDYHIERYEIIKSLWLKSFSFNKRIGKEIYSQVLDGHIYRCEADRKMYFYNYTGISYQVLDLVFELLNTKSTVENENIPNKQIKEWIKEDDKLYGILAKKIMEKMKDV